jgi:hypothetical protein
VDAVEGDKEHLLGVRAKAVPQVGFVGMGLEVQGVEPLEH